MTYIGSSICSVGFIVFGHEKVANKKGAWGQNEKEPGSVLVVMVLF